MPPADSTHPEPRSHRDAERAVHVTDTGWRIVGDAIPLVAAATAEASLTPGATSDVLFAVRLRLKPRLTRDRVIPVLLDLLTEAVRVHWPDAPPLLADRPLTRPADRQHGLQWETRGGAGAWAGELRWRYPHPFARGVSCLCQLVAREYPGYVMLTVQVGVPGGVNAVRGSVGAGQARPAFLSALRERVRVSADDVDSDPHVLGADAIDAFVRDVLLADRRELPVAVLSPTEEGEYLVPPVELANELAGLAHLYVLERHAVTFRLTDALGDRRLSCFYGALRVYMPEFSCADRPESHPLMLRDRVVDPVERSALVGQLALLAAQRVRMPAGVIGADDETEPDARAEARSASASSAHAHAPEATGAVAVARAPAPVADSTGVTDAAVVRDAPDVAGAALLATLSQLTNRLAELDATMRALHAGNAQLQDEVVRLRTSAAVRATSTAALERRLEGLESLLRATVAPPGQGTGDAHDSVGIEATPAAEHDAGWDDDEDSDRQSLREALRHTAATAHDTLLVLEAAERSAAESPYEDVDRVSVVLEAMARIARRRMEGGLGIPLRDAFREHGIDYRSAIASSTPERLRRQYRVQGEGGVVYECREHLVLGSSYDPRYCLRIYFTSRHPGEPRFVIGHVGRHFDVMTTT